MCGAQPDLPLNDVEMSNTSEPVTVEGPPASDCSNSALTSSSFGTDISHPLAAVSTPAEAELLVKLEQVEKKLREEVTGKQEAERQLVEKIDKLQDFQQLEKDLAESKAEALAIRKSWKKGAAEIDKLRTTGQGFYKMTDEYLVDLITQLRFAIRDFAIQYFDENPQETPRSTIVTSFINHKKRFISYRRAAKTYNGHQDPQNPDQGSSDRPRYLNFLQRVTPTEDSYQRYLTQPDKVYKIIEAFLWKVIDGTVFQGFLWMNEKDRLHFLRLRESLKPDRYSDSKLGDGPDPEAERKFQAWSATTTGLILDAVDSKKECEVRESLEKEQAEIVKNIKETIGHLSKPDNLGFDEQLCTIIDKALLLDKEISRQVARVVWVSDWGHSAKDEFDPETMELEKGDELHKDAQVRFVIAPGVMKRGKSTGEGFKKMMALLKPMVHCD
ncbi:hypothetical protein G7Z17_g5192 [Cylindrodendrum hubeiense]|uniref:Uncharacterized protein n=1 Tax=Cylindrodendrum hubeiense TaxID=595255 RepID=A0A9P5H7H3_9HYPO|nr:hypothetical protein G7Z17_g5192 [Cylindrodendrum hubeiense]